MKPPELEAMLLGAVLDSEEPAALIDASGLTSSDMLDPRVRPCWDLAVRLNARRRSLNAVTLFSAAKLAGQLREDDLAWLQALESRNTLDRTKFLQVAEDLRRTSRGRQVALQLESLATHVRTNGLQPAHVTGTLDAIAQTLIKDHAPDQTASGDVVEQLEEWDRTEKSGGHFLVPTGLEALDDVIRGWVPNLNLVLGDPAIGKNALIGSCILSQAKAGLKVGLFGLEEGHRWLTKRAMAKGLGMALGDIGAVKRSAEQDEKLGTVGPELTELLERVHVYSHDGITADELVRRATGWVLNRGVQVIYIDHIGEIRHQARDADGYNWAVANTYRRLRDFAKRYSVPVVILAHRKPESRNRQGPPKPEDCGMTGEAEKMTRLMLGLWKRGDALRATVIKRNDGETGVTVEFERLFTAALLEPGGGAKVNLQAEARKDSEARRAAKEEQADVAWLERKKRRKAIEGGTTEPEVEPEKPKPEPQASLFDAPPEAPKEQ